jgi:cytochrome c peroxidase
LEDVGTFDPSSPIEIRQNGAAPLGDLGFNVPSLLGVGYHAPYFHNGAAQTLPEVFRLHNLPGDGTIQTELNRTERADLLDFLKSLDGTTERLRSEADIFHEPTENLP